MAQTDFTPRQALKWVNQEFAKVTAENAVARLHSEITMIAFAKQRAHLFPNSLAAHQRLAELIRAAFPDVIAAVGGGS